MIVPVHLVVSRVLDCGDIVTLVYLINILNSKTQICHICKSCLHWRGKSPKMAHRLNVSGASKR